MDRVQKLTKADSIFFIVGVILIGIVFLLGVLYYFTIDSYNKSYDTNIISINDENVKAHVTTSYEPYAVAETSDGSFKYAIVIDENNIMWLIRGYVFTIQDLYKNQGSTGQVVLRGVSHRIEREIVGYTIDSYNEYADEIIVDEENFADFFGYYYLDLDDYTEEKFDIAVIYISLGFSALVLGAVFTIIGLASKNKTRKLVNSEIFPIISTELDNPEWETKKVVFTKNYIVFNKNGLNAINYKDVTWVYLHTFTYNGVPNNSFAYYIKGNKNVNLIPVGIKNTKALEMIEFVKNKNPNVLVGYTKENRELNKTLI